MLKPDSIQYRQMRKGFQVIILIAFFDNMLQKQAGKIRVEATESLYQVYQCSKNTIVRRLLSG